MVDDNATNGRVLHYQLAALNMPDEYASSAEKALRMLRAAAAAGMPYRLAILDQQRRKEHQRFALGTAWKIFDPGRSQQSGDSLRSG